MPTLHYTPTAARTLARLETGRRADPRRLRRVRQALEHLAADPHHPGLHSHRYAVLSGYRGTAWTSYVDQGPGAWRIHWAWGPGAQAGGVVTVLRVGPHL
ncbi:hypothetical protein [Kitasatospora sp. NPDC094016]|uniref:hypothetical protein n=1 Tax=Kitasatospora sp. NPDC094016 TaxID=3154986 RepID=UPI00331C575F